MAIQLQQEKIPVLQVRNPRVQQFPELLIQV